MPIIRRSNLEPEHWMVLAAYLGKFADDRKTPDCFHVFFPNGVTPEEIDETLNKYGLSCDDISQLGVDHPSMKARRRPVRPITGRRHADRVH